MEIDQAAPAQNRLVFARGHVVSISERNVTAQP